MEVYPDKNCHIPRERSPLSSVQVAWGYTPPPSYGTSYLAPVPERSIRNTGEETHTELDRSNSQVKSSGTA